MKLSLGSLGKGGITTDILMWGGLGIVALTTWSMLGTSLNRVGTGVENFGNSPIVTAADKTIGAFSNFAWSEGMPYRDKSVWYQWKSDFGSNDPTKRLTVA
jgi:hypothetical protein